MSDNTAKHVHVSTHFNEIDTTDVTQFLRRNEVSFS